MAEVALGILKDKLVPLLAAEARLLAGVRTEVGEITKQLEDILDLLKDADKKAEGEGGNSAVKKWVQELRDVALQMEDLVTEYTHHVDEQPPDCHEAGFQECLGEIASFLVFWCSKLKQRHDLGWQM